jgi:flagellar hook-associated protein 2
MSNDLGIMGLNSGIDTQAMIDKIMKYDKKPLESLKQKQQLLIWKQTAYRAQNTALKQLKDMIFDLKLEASYNTKGVTSTNSQVVTGISGTGAPNGSYSISVQSLATVATNTGTKAVSIRSQVAGDVLNPTITNPITIDSVSGNNQFTIDIDGGAANAANGGSTQTITLTDKTYDGTTGKTLTDLAADIQSKLTGGVQVKVNDHNQLVFYAAQKADGTAHTIVLNTVGSDQTLSNLGFANHASTKQITGSVISNPIIVDGTSNKFKITIGDNPTQEITLSNNRTYDPATPGDLAALASDIQTQIHNLNGIYANVQVSVNSLNQLQFNYTDASNPANPLSIKLETGSSQDVLWKTGISNGATSEAKNAISTDVTLWNQKDKFMDSGFFTGSGRDSASSGFSFTINGQKFNFTNNSNLRDIIDAINSSSTAGVIATYDDFNDKITLTSAKSGDNNPGGNEIQFDDPNGFLTQFLNIDKTKEQGGANAIVTINGVQTQKQSNTFTMNKVDFTLTGTGSAVVNVSTDTSGIAKKITDFVNKYNEIISNINNELAEKRATYGDNYTRYLPLSDEQKKEMSDDEIKTWNDKAQEGILHNDSILSSIISQLRTSLFRNVNTPRVITGNQLSGIINLAGSNKFTMTVGHDTRTITLDAGSYDMSDPIQARQFKDDIQHKLDGAFGGRVQVAFNNNAISFTSQNAAMTVNNGAQANGLNLLGFSNGTTVKASYSQLSQIGITTSTADALTVEDSGKLHLDTKALQAALENDPDGVMRLFTNNETITPPSDATPFEISSAKTLEKERQGIFYNLYDIISTQISRVTNQAGSTGTFGYDNELGKQLISLGEQIDTTTDRISAEEDRIRNMFNQMEVAIGRMNAQTSFISSMLGNSN